MQGHRPFGHRGAADARLTVAPAPPRLDRGPAVGVGAGIRGMRQHAVDGGRQGRPPFQVPPVRPVVGADAEPDVVLPEVAGDGVGGPQLVELVEDQADDPPDLLVEVHRQPAGRRLDVADRRVGEQLAAAGLVELAAFEATSDDMYADFRGRRNLLN